MPWSTPIPDDVLSEFTPDEALSLRTIQQGPETRPVDNLPAILGRTIAEFRDCIRSGGYEADVVEDTLPLGLHSDCIAVARWRWLISMPQLKQLETDVRERAFKRALEKLDRIADAKFAVEPPTSGTANRAGNWNSENKLVMRTHPVPKPASQFPPNPDDYANPDAPEDSART